MADNYKDKPENKGLRGAWRRGLPLGKAGTTYKQEFIEGIEKESFSSIAAVLPVVLGVPFLLLPGGAFLIFGGEDVRTYVQDQAVRPDLSAPAGYAAISADNGNSGYVLIHDEGRYRLYSFEANDKGERVLTYVEDADNAWHVIRQSADQFTRALAASGDRNASPPERNLENFRFEALGKPVQEKGKIFRVGTGITDADRDFGNMRARLSDQSEKWMAAAQAVFDGQYGFGAQGIEGRKGSFTEERVRDYTFMKWASISIFGISGLGLVGVAAGAAGRRLRAERDKKPG